MSNGFDRPGLVTLRSGPRDVHGACCRTGQHSGRIELRELRSRDLDGSLGSWWFELCEQHETEMLDGGFVFEPVHT